MNEEQYSVGGSYHGGVVNSVKGFTPRPEPDGQSDISSTSPDLLRQHQHRYDQRSPRRSILSTPPCTPVPSDEREGLAMPVTPAMLQSALDALEGIEDKDTPLSLTPRHRHNSESSHNAVLPGAVTGALTKWISSQSGGPSRSSLKTTPLLTPPPSTPEAIPIRTGSFEQSTNHGISAGDLIAALSTLKVSGTPGSRGSGSQGSRVPSVPACTPNEGGRGIEKWAELGIKPTDVIQALSALTIQQV